MHRSAALLTFVVTVLVGACTWLAPAASAYPQGTCPALQLSKTETPTSTTVEASGTNFAADEDVTLYSGGTVSVNGCDVTLTGGTQVATAHTDAQGSFDPPFTAPATVGTAPITGVGASGDSATIDLTVTNGSGTGPSGGGTPPSVTGVEIAAMVTLAVLLLGGGGLLLGLGRRRSTAARS